MIECPVKFISTKYPVKPDVETAKNMARTVESKRQNTEHIQAEFVQATTTHQAECKYVKKNRH